MLHRNHLEMHNKNIDWYATCVTICPISRNGQETVSLCGMTFARRREKEGSFSIQIIDITFDCIITEWLSFIILFSGLETGGGQYVIRPQFRLKCAWVMMMMAAIPLKYVYIKKQKIGIREGWGNKVLGTGNWYDGNVEKEKGSCRMKNKTSRRELNRLLTFRRSRSA